MNFIVFLPELSEGFEFLDFDVVKGESCVGVLVADHLAEMIGKKGKLLGFEYSQGDPGPLVDFLVKMVVELSGIIDQEKRVYLEIVLSDRFLLCLSSDCVLSLFCFLEGIGIYNIKYQSLQTVSY